MSFISYVAMCVQCYNRKTQRQAKEKTQKHKSIHQKEKYK